MRGVQHCGGVGPYVADYFDATSQWVEAGLRPSTRKLSVYKVDPGTAQIVLSRPLRRYPLFPRYLGTGDVNSASSFSCSAS
jgi:feruloyl esterase